MPNSISGKPWIHLNNFLALHCNTFHFCPAVLLLSCPTNLARLVVIIRLIIKLRNEMGKPFVLDSIGLGGLSFSWENWISAVGPECAELFYKSALLLLAAGASIRVSFFPYFLLIHVCYRQCAYLYKHMALETKTKNIHDKSQDPKKISTLHKISFRIQALCAHLWNSIALKHSWKKPQSI